MSYKTKPNISKSRCKRNRSRRGRRIEGNLYAGNQSFIFHDLSPSRTQDKFSEVITHKANGRVKKGIKAECVTSGVKSDSEVLTAKLSATKARNVYQRMYDQETIDNERAAKVLAKYHESILEATCDSPITILMHKK